MEYTAYYALSLLTLTFGVIAAGLWSAHVGRSVWSPGTLARRSFSRPCPALRRGPGSPLHISRTRFYSLLSVRPWGERVLTLSLKNDGVKPIHSFVVSYRSANPADVGALVSCPESLSPGLSTEVGFSVRGKADLTLSVDFVQFADGTVWFSGEPHGPVRENEMRAGARAAAGRLLAVWEERGARGVISALPRIHADVSDVSGGGFGFYCGVTNTQVRVRDIYRQDRLTELEAVLRAAG